MHIYIYIYMYLFCCLFLMPPPLSTQDHIRRTTSFIVLLRSGGFVLRALSVLFVSIRDALVLVPEGRPQNGNHNYAAYIRQHSTFFFKKYQRSYSDDGTTFDKALAAFESAWDDFLYWWNGTLKVV